MQSNDFEVFDGKTFSGLMKDIYDKSDNKSEKIGSIIDSLKTLIVTIEDAISILPMIKECLDVGVKNDEQLIKMASVVQRLVSSGKDGSGGAGGGVGFGLEESEWKELRDNANKEVKKLRVENERVDKGVKAISDKVEELVVKFDATEYEEFKEEQEEDEVEYDDVFDDEEEDLEEIAANIDEELIEFDELDIDDFDEFSKSDLQLEE